MLDDFSSVNSNASEVFGSDSYGRLLESNVYDATIKYVYLTESKKGTTGVNVVLDINGKEVVPEVAWINYSDGAIYHEINGKKQSTPGMKQFNELAYCALGLTVDRLGKAEQKACNIYNWEQKKQVPTMVSCFPAFTGKTIKVGIKKLNKHKQILVGSTYVPTKTIRPINTVDRYYTTDGKLAIEQQQGKEGAYMQKWLKDSVGKVFEENLKVTPIDDPKATADTPTESPAKQLGF